MAQVTVRVTTAPEEGAADVVRVLTARGLAVEVLEVTGPAWLTQGTAAARTVSRRAPMPAAAPAPVVTAPDAPDTPPAVVTPDAPAVPDWVYGG